HAARGLFGERGLRIGYVHFAPVAQALDDRTHRMFHPPDFEKTGDLTHWRRPRSPRRARAVDPPRRSGPPTRARAGNPAASPAAPTEPTGSSDAGWRPRNPCRLPPASVW